MKKVLFVIHTLGFGGAERSLINLLYELDQDQYEVDLLLFKKQGAFLRQLPAWVNLLETPEDIKALYSPVSKAGKRAFTKIVGTACSKILRKTRKERAAFRWKYFYKKKIAVLPTRYDVAVAYSGAEVMYLIRDCVEADKKLVWIHNDYRTAGYSRDDDLPYLADMDAIVSVSEECVNTLNEIFPQYRDRTCCVENITSSVLVRNRADAYIPEEYKENFCNLLSVGRLVSQKGFDLAITAAAIMKKSGLQFRWYIIGEGMLQKKLEKQIRDEAVEDCVILLGTRENPYPYIKHCTILVQPSRFEGKSVVLDETKILSKPILTTAYPTAADQIRDGFEGVIVDMTPRAIAEGILRILQDEALLLHIQQYLKDHEYGNQSEVEKYTKLLDAK